MCGNYWKNIIYKAKVNLTYRSNDAIDPLRDKNKFKNRKHAKINSFNYSHGWCSIVEYVWTLCAAVEWKRWKLRIIKKCN
jgi:hypothetical protein